MEHGSSYDEHHFSIPTDLHGFSLGTKNKDLRYGSDGSLTIHAGADSPGKDKESNWLPAPDGHFSLYIRAYWGKEPVIDGTRTPPEATKK